MTVYLLHQQGSGSVSITPDVVNFNAPPRAGGHFEVDVTVTNTAPNEGSVTLESIEFNGAGVHSGALNYSGFSLPVTLDANGPSANYTITFDPTSDDPFPAGVTASFNFEGLGSRLVSILAGSSSGPVLSVSPDSLSFPNGTPGNPETKELTVSNLGDGTLVLGTLRIEPPAAREAYTVSVSNLTVPRQNSEVISITYDPPTTDSVNGSLRMIGQNGLEEDVPLFGGAAAPSGAANPDVIEFNAAPGDTQTREFAISNVGAAPLIVSSADLSALGSEFTLSGLNFPVTVEPGELASATITFARNAGDVGQDIGNLVLQTNNPGTGELIILVRNNNDENALPPSAVITQTPDGTVALGSTVTLSSSDSDGNGSAITTVEWTLLEKPNGSSATLSDVNAESTTFEADAAGNYRVQLTVSNGQTEGSTTRTITVAQ